jgi:cytochrome c oxidase subunit 2
LLPRRAHLAACVRVAFPLGTILALAGCSGPLSTLDPAGPAAASVATLWWIMLAGAVVLFALVALLLLISYRKPALIAAISPTRWLVGLGLVMPAIVLTALVSAALVHGEQLLPHRGEIAPMRIEAHAERWRWTFRYPDIAGAAATENILHLPAGEPVDIVVTGGDVIHSFWIPRLGGKIDAIPGHTNIIRLSADRPGSYRGVCAEFCGEGHSGMTFFVEAHERAELAAAIGGAR